MLRKAKKIGLFALFFSMTLIAFALAPYPSYETASKDLKANWRIEGDQGTWVSATRTADWVKKVVIRDKVQVTLAILNYTVRIEFPYFFRDFDTNVVYIYSEGEWIFDGNVLLGWKDEQKKGVLKIPPVDEMKALIKKAFEEEPQSFFDSLSTTLEPVAPVTVLKVLISDPDEDKEDLVYYADVEFLESKPGLFAKPKTFVFENLIVRLNMVDEGSKVRFGTYFGELKLSK